jgi:hypothetical protein
MGTDSASGTGRTTEKRHGHRRQENENNADRKLTEVPLT